MRPLRFAKVSANSQWGPLLVILAAFLVVGVVLADDYGAEIDELTNARVGANALKSYWSPDAYRVYMSNGDPLAQHGPSYFMVFSAASQMWSRVFPGWRLTAGRHFTNYLTFLLAITGFYFLVSRVVSRRIAWMGTILFATQPLLFGHAFINQKDTPFMAFFLVSVVSGMAAADRFGNEKAARGNPQMAAGEPMWSHVTGEWGRAEWWRKWTVLIFAAVAILVAFDICVTEFGLELMKHVVGQAYAGQAWGPIQRAFDVVAQDAYKTPLAAYIQRLLWGYWLGRLAVLAALAGAGAGVAVLVAPELAKRVWHRYGASVALVLLSAALTGFTISIRPIGGFAGALVSLYWLYRHRVGAIGLLVLYWLATSLAMCLTWPFLWDAPIRRLLESLVLTADSYPKPTLYQGALVYSNHLPWHYFPTLAAITLTEVVTPLFLLGAWGVIRNVRTRRLDHAVLITLGLWTIIPLVGLLFFNIGIYNNIKHLHFVLPPMLVCATYGLGMILESMPRAWLGTAAFALVLVPGILGIARLHPYEYIYYNSFVGGVHGAAGRYTLDRLCTSYREAMRYVNKVAIPDAAIAAPGAPLAAEEFAREDLRVSHWHTIWPGSDYVITCSFFTGQLEGDPKWHKLFVIGRENVAFAEVYQRADLTPGGQ